MRRALPLLLALPLTLAGSPADASHRITTTVRAGGADDAGAYAAVCETQTAVATSIVLTCTVGDLSRTTKGVGTRLAAAVAGPSATVPVEACARVTATMFAFDDLGPYLVTETETTCAPLVLR